MSKDNAFYLRAWDSRQSKRCEECGEFLPGFSPYYISHIVSKGSNPGLRHDLRNFNLLCPRHHNQWEFGKRSEMKIFEKNKLTKELLTLEYYERRDLPGNEPEDGQAEDSEQQGEQSDQHQ